MIVAFIPGCQEEYLYLPGIGNYTYPLTTLEHEQLIQCPGVPGITVTRVCGENGQWMEPDYLSCSVAILEQNRNNIQNLLDKVRRV